MYQEHEQSPVMEQELRADETVRHVVSEVLETMFFTEAEVSPCEHGWLESAACAGVRFEGSHFGEMLLGVSEEATDAMASGFLGLDPLELTDALRGQVIQELSNILCGALLSHLWPESKLALASPELTTWQAWPDADVLHRCFLLPEGMLALSIRLIAYPCAVEDASEFADSGDLRGAGELQ